jgi:hypothetical protein
MGEIQVPLEEDVKLQNLVIVWDGRKLPLHGGGFSGTWFCNLVEGLILGLYGGGGGLLQKADMEKNEKQT